jgi:hypothetical protein
VSTFEVEQSGVAPAGQESPRELAAVE